MTMGQKPKQQAFDFNRAARLRWIDLARINTRGPGKACLRALEAFQRSNPTAWPSMPALAGTMGVSTRTAQRIIRELSQQGLISISPRSRTNGSASSNEFTINWGKIMDLVPTGALDVVTPCHHPPVTVSPPPCHRVTTLVTPCHPLKHTLNQPSKHLSKHHEGQEGKTFWGRRQPLTADDLHHHQTCGSLFRFGVERGWLPGDQGHRLRFYTLCLHCAREADNPGAMLTANVKAKRWAGGDGDEAIARAWIDAERVGPGGPAVGPPERRSASNAVPLPLFRDAVAEAYR